MLPTKVKNTLFDPLSDLPMRYVHAVPTSEAEGLVAEVYEQVVEDFLSTVPLPASRSSLR